MMATQQEQAPPQQLQHEEAPPAAPATAPEAHDGDNDAAASSLQAATSVRFLRLQNDFKTVLKSGLGCIDEQAFTELFQGRAAPHQLKHMWLLLQQQCASIMAEACAELEVACSEVGLQQQLEELEGLVLQRGLLGATADGTGSVADAAAVPAAAEAAARVAAKQAEKQQLLQALQQLQQRKQQLAGELSAKQAAAGELVADFKAVEDQVDKVYKASKQWQLRPADAAAADCAARPAASAATGDDADDDVRM